MIPTMTLQRYIITDKRQRENIKKLTSTMNWVIELWAMWYYFPTCKFCKASVNYFHY